MGILSDLKNELDFVIPTNSAPRAQGVARSISCDVRIFNGTGYPSYAKLWNDCVRSSTKEIVLICGDKAHPTDRDLDKMLQLLRVGFGSVQLYCLGIHCFYKDLINQIGWMDERFSGGGGEHPDFLLRHKEANIAYYESLEVEYDLRPTTWKSEESYVFLHQKWRTPRIEGELDYDQRLLPEVPGPRIQCASRAFLPYYKSVILTGNQSLYHREMRYPCFVLRPIAQDTAVRWLSG